MNQAALLLGFGGPRARHEVIPFLQSVLAGVPVAPSRFDEVAAHYQHFDGRSPYNEITERQRSALQTRLEFQGIHIPVLAAFRHSTPSFEETLERLKKERVNRVIVQILSSFKSFASHEKYLQKFEEAQKKTRTQDIELCVLGPLGEEEFFIRAQADQLRNYRLPKNAHVIFTAHSIPQAMSAESGYEAQFKRASERVARELKAQNWTTAYQSRSGRPQDPWLEPDVNEVIRKVNDDGNIVLVPIGFICDNVEVLYDLDVEAQKSADLKKLQFYRASTVMDHPMFIDLLARRIKSAMENKS